MSNIERAYERGMQEGLDLRDELRERIATLTEQIGDRDQDLKIAARQLVGAVELREAARTVVEAWQRGHGERAAVGKLSAALDAFEGPQ